MDEVFAIFCQNVFLKVKVLLTSLNEYKGNDNGNGEGNIRR